MASSYAIIALDTTDMNKSGALSVRETCEALSSVIVDWNMNMQYCAYSLTGKKANEGNCQDFCNDILSRLNIKASWKADSLLGKFLHKMQLHGVCEPIYEPSKAAKEALELKDSYTFTSHKELDQAVSEWSYKASTMAILYRYDFPEDMEMLKCFDRGFWYQHFATPTVLNEPLMHDEYTCACYFSDPRETKTFMGRMAKK